MKAMIINGFGGADRLETAEVPTPTAQADEVLIRVAYAGVNPVDWKIREGMLEGFSRIAFRWSSAGTQPAPWPQSERQ